MADGKLKVNVKTPDVSKIFKNLEHISKKNAEKALTFVAEAVLSEMILRQVIPFREGRLQNDAQVGYENGHAYVLFDKPYAKKIYYGVKFKFNHKSNPHAQAKGDLAVMKDVNFLKKLQKTVMFKFDEGGKKDG